MTQTNYYNNEDSFKNYLSKTFSTVAIGVAISAVVAYLAQRFVSPLIALVSIVAELAIAFYFSLRLNSMSKTTAWACYFIYAVTTGISFSTIISAYAGASVVLAFASTAIMFVCMSIIGHTSNFDFTKIYMLFVPALLAGIIISLINAFFIHSAMINMIIVYIGLVLFLVITAADVQKLRSFYYASQGDSELSEKLMIMGAFQLYLDFANLFIKILQIFGRRRDQ